MTKLEEVIKAFDGFLKETGGNLDPRARGNRDRTALLHFFEVLLSLTPNEALRYMRLIIKNRWTSHNIDGSPGFKSIDKNDLPLARGFQVYDYLGQLIDSRN